MPFDLKAGVAWAKAHPWGTGGIVFGVGLVLLFLMRGKGGSSGGSSNLAAYLQAETAQNAQDNAAYLGKAQADAATAQLGITTAAQTDIQHTWAATQLAETNAANDASQKMSLIQYFGTLANNIGQVLTSSSSSQSGSGGGLNLGFGNIGFGFNSNSNSASSSSTQTLAANTQQAAAEHELELIAGSYYPAH